MTERFEVEGEAAMRELAATFARRWSAGDLVLLIGELGAGKTTFVRGLMAALGVPDGVRSPTFNLMQVFETHPPVLHADLYRVSSASGLGLEDYLETHLCLVEWPDRGMDLLGGLPAWTVQIDFAESGRIVQVSPPAN